MVVLTIGRQLIAEARTRGVTRKSQPCPFSSTSSHTFRRLVQPMRWHQTRKLTRPKEPSTLPHPTTTTKKNRPDPSTSTSTPAHARSGTSATETSTISEEDAPRASIDDGPEGAEGQNIGEVRRKVASMTHEDLHGKAAEMAAPTEADEAGEGQEVVVPDSVGKDEPGSAMNQREEDTEDITDGWVDVDKSAAAGAPTDAAQSPPTGEGLKRKAIDRSESNLLSAEGSKRQKETPSVCPSLSFCGLGLTCPAPIYSSRSRACHISSIQLHPSTP